MLEKLKIFFKIIIKHTLKLFKWTSVIIIAGGILLYVWWKGNWNFHMRRDHRRKLTHWNYSSAMTLDDNPCMIDGLIPTEKNWSTNSKHLDAREWTWTYPPFPYYIKTTSKTNQTASPLKYTTNIVSSLEILPTKMFSFLNLFEKQRPSFQ